MINLENKKSPHWDRVRGLLLQGKIPAKNWILVL